MVEDSEASEGEVVIHLCKLHASNYYFSLDQSQTSLERGSEGSIRSPMFFVGNNMMESDSVDLEPEAPHFLRPGSASSNRLSTRSCQSTRSSSGRPFVARELGRRRDGLESRASAEALDEVPRDPRFVSYKSVMAEHKWDNSSPLSERFIPEYRARTPWIGQVS